MNLNDLSKVNTGKSIQKAINKQPKQPKQSKEKKPKTDLFYACSGKKRKPKK